MAAYFAMLAAGYQPVTVLEAFREVVADMGSPFPTRNEGPNLVA